MYKFPFQLFTYYGIESISSRSLLSIMFCDVHLHLKWTKLSHLALIYSMPPSFFGKKIEK